jgi:hypothetical protein
MLRISASALVIAIGSLVGCSSATSNDTSSGGAGGGSNGGSGGTGVNLAGSGGGGGSITQSCGGEVKSGQSVPLDLFIMLDQSGSMSDSSKWVNVTNALNTFFAAPPSPDMAAGLQYFGQPAGPCTQNIECGIDSALETFTCTNGQCIECALFPLPGIPPICLPPGLADSCNPADYASAEVDIAPLDAAQAAKLSTSIAQHGPSTGTPTSAALDGALQFATQWQVDHPNRKTAVVLATDGEPSGCDNDIAHIAAIAGKAQGGTPSIDTFVIGVGSSLHDLDPVAAQGGTNVAIVVDYSQQAFVDALNNVSNLAAACEYVLPTDSSGGVDITKVNVLFTPSGATDPTTIGKVGGAANCGPNGGWYYDNDAAPKKVLICPASCDQFKADSGAKVEFRLGCKTVVQ